MLASCEPSLLRSFVKISPPLDRSTNSIIFDRSKCGFCRSCVKACSTIAGQKVLQMVKQEGSNTISTSSGEPLAATNCIKCGQCTLACGPGALSEKTQITEVTKELKNLNGRVSVCQVAPAVRVNISDALGLPAGTVSTGRLVTALKLLGFQYVFDTDFSADLTILEEANEFVSRLTKGTGKLPIFTSCCPAWINYVEQSAPELIPNLSTCRSPLAMLSSLIQHEFAPSIGKPVFNVAIMPCVAKKDEIERPQFKISEKNDKKETDYVLTTRELAKMIKKAKIDFKNLPITPFDKPYSESTGAGVIFGVTGGVMEAAIRTAYEIILKKPLPGIEFKDVRGQDGIKIANTNIAGLNVTFAVAHGIANAMNLIEKIKAGDPALVNLRFVEVMACPGGCVCGGGSTRARTKTQIGARTEAIYHIDQAKEKRVSTQNLDLNQEYKNFLGAPNSHKAHELLHTHYNDRKK